jgi:hypothetical protein
VQLENKETLFRRLHLERISQGEGAVQWRVGDLNQTGLTRRVTYRERSASIDTTATPRSITPTQYVELITQVATNQAKLVTLVVGVDRKRRTHLHAFISVNFASMSTI